MALYGYRSEFGGNGMSLSGFENENGMNNFNPTVPCVEEAGLQPCSYVNQLRQARPTYVGYLNKSRPKSIVNVEEDRVHEDQGQCEEDPMNKDHYEWYPDWGCDRDVVDESDHDSDCILPGCFESSGASINDNDFEEEYIEAQFVHRVL